MPMQGNGVVGVLQEQRYKWERRSPLTPVQCGRLLRAGIHRGGCARILVQPSSKRIFTDTEYLDAGCELSEDLSEAGLILGVKQPPLDGLLSGRAYVFFSHTHKAQPDNMQLLDEVIQKEVTLYDYEVIVDRSGRRLVAFGEYAGRAGMIDFLRGLGERFLALGYSTPFLNLGSSYMYPSLVAAQAALLAVGHEIAAHGLPPAVCPLVFAFTGTGNASRGAQEIFRLLPHCYVEVDELPSLVSTIQDPTATPPPTGVEGGRQASGRWGRVPFQIFGAVATAEHCVAPNNSTAPFDKKEYYAHPDSFHPIFHLKVAPYVSAIINCIYWERRFPRLLSSDQLQALAQSQGGVRLLGVADITCDVGGSIECLDRTTPIERPFFRYDPIGRTYHDDMDGPGIFFLAVDILPTELPRESTQHFGDALFPFVGPLAYAATWEQAPEAMRRACIASGGKLTPLFEYIDRVRQGQAEEKMAEQAKVAEKENLAVVVSLDGHLFDQFLINEALDVIENAGGRFWLSRWEIGQTAHTPSHAEVVVSANTEVELGLIVESLAEIAGVKIPMLPPAIAARTQSNTPRRRQRSFPSLRTHPSLLNQDLPTDVSTPSLRPDPRLRSSTIPATPTASPAKSGKAGPSSLPPRPAAAAQSTTGATSHSGASLTHNAARAMPASAGHEKPIGAVSTGPSPVEDDRTPTGPQQTALETGQALLTEPRQDSGVPPGMVLGSGTSPDDAENRLPSEQCGDMEQWTLRRDDMGSGAQKHGAAPRGRVLILGAGRVCEPAVRKLGSLGEGYWVTVASMFLEEAEAVVAAVPDAVAIRLDVSDKEALDACVADADVVVSLLPAACHAAVGDACIKAGKHLVTASYVSEDVQALDERARAAGVTVLCEMGLDPGIDHMSAMEVIEGIHARGGHIRSFVSMCGGLPSPEAANNPLGYKFSWSPRAALLAGRQHAVYQHDGTIFDISGDRIFSSAVPLRLPNHPAFALEQLPNRDSLSYSRLYGIDAEVSTVMRATLRYQGFGPIMDAIAILGYFDMGPLPVVETDDGLLSHRDVLLELVRIRSVHMAHSSPSKGDASHSAPMPVSTVEQTPSTIECAPPPVERKPSTVEHTAPTPHTPSPGTPSSLSVAPSSSTVLSPAANPSSALVSSGGLSQTVPGAKGGVKPPTGTEASASDCSDCRLCDGDTWREAVTQILLHEARREWHVDDVSRAVDGISWLGLVGLDAVAPTCRSPFDVLVKRMETALAYRPGEHDMVILHHEIVADFDEQSSSERHTSTLLQFGNEQESAMARTVGLTAAIGAQLLFEGRVEGRGVLRPTTPDIYEPALMALAAAEVACVDHVDILR